MQFNFIEAPFSVPETKRFAMIEDSLGFLALCDTFEYAKRKKIELFSKKQYLLFDREKGVSEAHV